MPTVHVSIDLDRVMTCACDLCPCLQRVHALLEAAHHSCGSWVTMADMVEQGISGLSAALGVLRVTPLNQKQKGEATRPVLLGLEKTVADLQAQLAGEQKSHQLTQVCVTTCMTCEYRAHIRVLFEECVILALGQRTIQRTVSRHRAEELLASTVQPLYSACSGLLPQARGCTKAVSLLVQPLWNTGQ